MRVVIFSDIHGNLPATEAMLKHAGPADAYICLGDIVNYGPWSDECVDIVRSLPNVTILEGNHESYFLSGKYDGKNLVASTFFEFCYPKFSSQDKIKNLHKTYHLKNFAFAHTINNQYVYPDTELKLDGNYVIGHSHHQFKLSQPPYQLYNAGSVGQNRGYINVINYLVLETEVLKFDMCQLIYDETVVINEMKKRGYPKLCIGYYDSKPRLRL